MKHGHGRCPLWEVIYNYTKLLRKGKFSAVISGYIGRGNEGYIFSRQPDGLQCAVF